MNKLPSEFSFNVTVDNLNISLALLNHLSENGIGGTGTLKANRTDHCHIKDLKVISKEDCGSYNYRYDSANKVIFARRNEIRIVTLAPNSQPVYPIGTTKRYSWKEKKIVDVSEKNSGCPFSCSCQMRQFRMLGFYVDLPLAMKTSLWTCWVFA